MKPKVLIVEDDDLCQTMYTDCLGKTTEILSATTLEDGKRLFDENPDIAIVVMDACVPGGKPNSMKLVKHIRKTFSGPMIAASSDSDYQDILVEAGCSLKSPKYEVPSLVRELLRNS